MPVLYASNDGVATLTLSRPERRNALSAELVDDLFAALDRLAADDDVACAVLTGEGKAFCAGGDLAGGMMADGGVLAARRKRARFAELLERLHTCGRPVIAAVNGDALGGGFGLAMACDMVVLDPGARLGTPEIRLGLFPMIILAELTRNVPRKRLSEMIYTGRRITADEAVAWNIANRVSEAGEALSAAHELAGRVAAHSPAILRLGKDAFFRAEDLPLSLALAYLHEQLEANLLAEDAAEGVGAFLQKRAPVWKGR
ncbi:MAG: crotonase [Proteobacteria bacterium]|nr:crotonase [Pseudomonadota bacterium]MCP4919167.1 crotonase [Pseudomonadota bacterium]